MKQFLKEVKKKRRQKSRDSPKCEICEVFKRRSDNVKKTKKTELWWSTQDLEGVGKRYKIWNVHEWNNNKIID